MRTGLRGLAIGGLILVAVQGAPAEATIGERQITLSGQGYALVLDARDGSILSLTQGGQEQAILTGGEWGLWRAQLAGGKTVRANDYAAEDGQRRFLAEMGADGDTVQLSYRGPEVSVDVEARAGATGVEWRAQVRPLQAALLEFELPARLRFDPAHMTRLISPMNGNTSVGAAFLPGFFQEQPQARPMAWRSEPSGPVGYHTLYGGGLQQRADADPAVALRVTPEGRAWIGEATGGSLEGTQATVNRPPAAGQADLVLVDSDNGPYFSASHLGGEGYLWRLGGAVGDGEKGRAAAMVSAVLAKLVAEAPEGRTKVGLAALDRGPQAGGWANVPVAEWQQRISQLLAARRGQVTLELLTTPERVVEAARSREYLAILNPYGEGAPVPVQGTMADTVAAVGGYVRGGGNWFEVGGYPFFYALRPVRYLYYASGYPAAFADFYHLDTPQGSASVYRAQPRTWEAWAAATDPQKSFTAGRLACGGDAEGGYLERPYTTYVAPGEEWPAPPARLVVGRDALGSLRGYCAANGITRRLEDKMAPEVLERFRQSVLVYLAGNARDKLAHLDLLPTPTLIHFADYLKGGFDKQYPDHLPPNAGFGTQEELLELVRQAQARGHLVMPYTNPTWWCDHPRGPTFERWGEDPLLKQQDGRPSYERYAANDGWTITLWHPAVREANRETVRQFAEEVPVDLLFEDQCGARGWARDFNPASPRVDAFSEGMISLVQEDSRTRPLSTEGGWDGVVNWESQLCGMTWALVPTEGGPGGRTYLKQDYPPETWEVFPVAQAIAHDKTAMIHHDLGQFVTTPETLAWTLAIGFNLSYTTSAAGLAEPANRGWLQWLDRLQKSVCARYTGAPVVAFEHQRPDPGRLDDDGIIRATYGEVSLTVNLCPRPREVDGRELGPFGFYITAPGTVAASLERVGAGEGQRVAYVAQGDEVWVYGTERQRVTVELPGGRQVALQAPDRPGVARVAPPAELAGRAPLQWPGERPAIGIIDLGEGVNPTWTRVQPRDWFAAVEASAPVAERGVPLRALTTSEDVMEALGEGATRWLAIVNPYGELFPESGPGRWRETLEAIRQYVTNGGCWWETGGYSFHVGVWRDAAGWHTEMVGPQGAGLLGLAVGGGEIEQPAEPLKVTEEGRRWLGEETAQAVERAASVVNRGEPRGARDAGHLALVTGAREDFIGGYRLGGWGWLWRIGGFWPDRDVATTVAAKALEHLYLNAPEPPLQDATRFLWEP